MPDQVYFADSAVKITNIDATFGSRRFDMAEIASARIQTQWDETQNKWALWVGFALILVTPSIRGLILFVPDVVTIPYIALVPLLTTLLGVLVLYFGAAQLRVRYIVKISGTFGEVDVVVARRWQYARKIVKAIKAATQARPKASLPGGQTVG